MCSQFIAHRPSPRNKNFTIFLYSKCCGDILGRIRKLIKLTRKLRVISKKSGRFVHQNENCRRTELGNPPLCLQMYTNQNPPPLLIDDVFYEWNCLYLSEVSFYHRRSFPLGTFCKPPPPWFT